MGVSTRSRKRSSGESNALPISIDSSSTDGVRKRRTRSSTASDGIQDHDDEPSLEPKAKRQKATSQTKKARALKPVAANVTNKTAGAATNRSARLKRGTDATTEPDEEQSHHAKKPAAVSRSKKSTASNKSTKSSTSLRSGRSSGASKKNTTTASSKTSATNEASSCQLKQGKEQQKRKKVARSNSTKRTATSTAASVTGNSTTAIYTTTTTKNDVKQSATGTKNSEAPSHAASSELYPPNTSGKSYQELRRSVGSVHARDIDEENREDPLYVTDYAEDMYEHFRSKEGASSVDRMYLGTGGQMHISESMRCILVDWLIEVHYKFKLIPETLYLTINILDRFLSGCMDPISKRDLQLVGVTALLVASKYEEMYIPELRDLTYICDGAYTELKILSMEEKILKTLRYNCTVPTPYTFLLRFLKAGSCDTLTAQIANFVLDGTLLTLKDLTCKFLPSELASAAVFIARRAVGDRNWSATLVKYAYYEENEVARVAQAVITASKKIDANGDLLALKKKYSKTKYGKVSHYTFDNIQGIDDFN